MPPLGRITSAVAPVVGMINRMPVPVRQALYSWMGWVDAAPVRMLPDIDMETIARWAVGKYPQRRYPAALIGSSNGAGSYLGAALGIPWLPQTVLAPIRRTHITPEEAQRDLEWGREHVQPFLARNRDVRVYQMHDPNQDRLMLARMAYFRLKRLRLGPVYEQFLERSLAPGATLYLLECQLAWPATQVSERHIYQFGGKGGITNDEYLHGGERVAAYLRRHGADADRWYPPVPDGEYPEAEWGFDEELRADVARFAAQRGLRVRRIVFQAPQHLSPLVTDLYRWWYRQRGLPGNQLLVESFVNMQPWWGLRNGMVPFWTAFNDQPSAEHLAHYLEGTAPYDEIFLTVFSNCIDSIGIASIEQWRAILARARRQGQFLGTEPRAHPYEFASYVPYYTGVKRHDAGCPMPDPLSIDQLNRFLAQNEGRYQVRWVDVPESREVAR